MADTLTTMRAALSALVAVLSDDQPYIEASKKAISDLSALIASMEAQPEHMKFPQFLTDVVTAAGLLAHGKQDKGLAARIASYAYELRTTHAQPSEPKAEPVANTAADHVKGEIGYCTFHSAVPNKTKLYAAPQTRKQLTEDQIANLFPSSKLTNKPQVWLSISDGILITRAVERAHGIEGGAA